MALSLVCYAILQVLEESEYTAILKSVSVSALAENPDLSQFALGTIYRSIDSLVGSGYIAYGARIGTAYTYYITKKGIEHLHVALG